MPFNPNASSRPNASDPNDSPSNPDFKISKAPGGDPFYADRPLPKLPTWKVPTNPEEQKLFFAQITQMMDFFQSVNPNVSTPVDAMDLIENLLFQVHQKKLDEIRDIEAQITANQFNGYITGDNELKDNSEPLLNGIWPRKGLTLLTAPPGYGKTLTVFHLIKQLELNSKSILYCGMDEDESGVVKKLKSLEYENWPCCRLPDGLSGPEGWNAIEKWEIDSKLENKRFLILDLLMHYAPMEVNSPGSIVNALSRVVNFANKNNVVVVGLCHSSLGSIAPTGHQTLWGMSKRLIILRENESPNTVTIEVTRRGPNKTLEFTHPWIDIPKAKELLERGNTAPKKMPKVNQAKEWLDKHPEMTSKEISISLLKETAEHHEEDPLMLSHSTWNLARKAYLLEAGE